MEETNYFEDIETTDNPETEPEVVETQPESQADEQPEGEKDASDLLGEYEPEKPEGEEDPFLKSVNDLNLIRNGEAIQYENKEAIISDLQKAYDYTQKTQTLSDERKQLETDFQTKEADFEASKKEFETYETEVRGALDENNIMGEVLAEMQVNDPELFAEIQQAFQNRMNNFNQSRNNPEVTTLRNELAEIKNSLAAQDQGKVDKEHAGIREQYEQEQTAYMTANAVKLKSLGLKVDDSKVQEIYAADSTGKMSYKAAFNAVYGEQVRSLIEGKAKLATIKAKAASKGIAPAEQKVEKIEQDNSYDSYINNLSHSMGLS